MQPHTRQAPGAVSEAALFFGAQMVLQGLKIYCVGIKGTGLSSLAAELALRGAAVAGSDSGAYFITEELLRSRGIHWDETDEPDMIDEYSDLVIYSSAYCKTIHPQLIRALRLGIRTLSYNEMLGELSGSSRCCAVSGAHGKTTAAALIDYLLDCAGERPFSVYGSRILKPAGEIGHVTEHREEMMVVEACEYRDHFLLLHPDIALITNIDWDHPDWFADRDAVEESFLQFTGRISSGGSLLYCADDEAACRVAAQCSEKRDDIHLVPYGEKADGLLRVTFLGGDGANRFQLGERELALPLPGFHMVLNAAGAIGAAALLRSQGGSDFSRALSSVLDTAAAALPRFPGLTKRTERVGEIGGILVLDDYAHHPQEIKATLAGLRNWYRGRRIVLSFMAHTYSRTEAFLDDFIEALCEADAVLIHPVFPSARETQRRNAGLLAGRIAGAVPVESDEEAAEAAVKLLHPGDLFVTMGAGSNRRTGELVLRRLRKRSSS